MNSKIRHLHKERRSVLLVKRIEPFAVFKINERRFASYRRVSEKAADTQSKNNSAVKQSKGSETRLAV